MNWEAVGKRIRDARMKKSLLQSDLAKLLNITQPAYNMYEQGKRPIDIPKLKTICRVLDLNIKDFF